MTEEKEIEIYNGKLMLVVSSPSGRDNIFIGYAYKQGDTIILKNASMVVRYEEVGVLGLSAMPKKAVRLRPAPTDACVIIQRMNIAYAVEADESAWKEHLGISR